MDALVKSLLIGIIVVSIIILALILTLWGKARVHETGVFLSLGIKKGNILGQYIAEVLLIAVFAFAASGITSNMFAATVADTLLQQTVQSNSLQDNAEDDTTMQSIDMSSALEDEETISPNIQISLGLEDLLRLYLHRVFYYRCFRNGFFGQRYALETERYSKPHELKKGGKSNVNFGL